MKRLLVIAFGVPPTPGPNPSRALHLARHLPTHGWEAILLTPRHPRRQLCYERTREHRNYPIPLRQVAPPRDPPYWLQETGYRDLLASWRRIRPPEPVDPVLPGLYGRYAPTPEEIALEPPPGPRGASQWLERWLRCNPDARGGWVRPGLQAAHAVCDALPPDAVLSISPPVSAHRIAMRVAENLRVPWIADLREPWKGAAPAPIDSMRAARVLRLAIRASDLPPSFDERDLGSAGDPGRPFVLIHAGPTAGRGRDCAILLDAIRSLLDARSFAREALRVRLLGSHDRRIPEMIGARALAGVVTLEPRVPWEVSIETQADASALLLALGPGDEGRIPDRALEALAVRRPVLAFGTPAARVREFLAATRLGGFSGDAASLADAIRARAPFSIDEDAVAPYRAENLAARIAERLEAPVGGKRRAGGRG